MSGEVKLNEAGSECSSMEEETVSQRTGLSRRIYTQSTASSKSRQSTSRSVGGGRPWQQKKIIMVKATSAARRYRESSHAQWSIAGCRARHISGMQTMVYMAEIRKRRANGSEAAAKAREHAASDKGLVLSFY